MILPLLAILGLAYLGSQVGKSLSKSGVHYQPPTISGVVPPRVAGAKRAYSGVIRVERNRQYLWALKYRLSNRLPVTRWLVGKALDEAMTCNDVSTIIALSKLLSASPKQAPAFPKHRRAVRQPEETREPEPEGEGERQEPMSDGPQDEMSELGQDDLQSPLPGISNDDWMEFVARVRTKAPGFKSDKYVGQYEQNRGRLKQLGIAEPANAEQEHEALAADMAAHAEDFVNLDREHSGDILELDVPNPDTGDNQHPICASGILGLLKYAGPEGARSWLSNPEDRQKYPKTTEAFLRTNGLF